MSVLFEERPAHHMNEKAILVHMSRKDLFMNLPTTRN